MSFWSKVNNRIRLPVSPDDEYADNPWCNNDLKPMPRERRTYGAWSFVLYWVTGGFSIVNYTTGASFIAYGLSGQQAIICAVIAPLILCVSLLGTSLIGARQHISFMIFHRSVLGMWGSHVVLVIRTIPGFIYDGIEALWGGQCVACIFGALSPTYYTKLDIDLAGGRLKLYDFVGFIIYYITFLLVMRIPPERLQRSFIVSSVLFTATVIGFLSWSVSKAGGAGPYFNGTLPAVKSEIPGWSVMFGIMAFVGVFSPATASFMDWSRYSTSRNGPAFVQMIAMPVCMGGSCVIGIIVASCSEQIFGEAIWQPFMFLRAIQLDYYKNNAGSRAASFFAGAACFFAQVNLNIILNSVGCAMDLSAAAPRYLNIQRAAYVIAAVGVATCPWYLLSSAGTFLNVLAGFSVFTGPMTSLAIVDFFVIRKMHMSLPDLYIGNSSSIYWYHKGWSWRAFTSFIAGVIPTFPGFVMAVANPARPLNGWIYLYHLCYLVGFAVTGLVHLVICKISPPPHQYEGATTYIEADEIDVVAVIDSGVDDEKDM
ncbi:permease for cytosine/purines, uracil, thiamine, allantoin-domain-containing protein [Naematelia encephala]|uniref:Permease for cytosine/purines, uracil, thiamine, allantoin-domain-containing protein n=1 Tax=Naematelia encephala TaxID=71784 RepID=A0A1Y2AQR2_9TREE|nr:permease for cytosine/purines, uracil, thiamine, allantoin-domain-containing protein [Naematelia encephala]